MKAATIVASLVAAVAAAPATNLHKDQARSSFSLSSGGFSQDILYLINVNQELFDFEVLQSLIDQNGFDFLGSYGSGFGLSGSSGISSGISSSDVSSQGSSSIISGNSSVSKRSGGSRGFSSSFDIRQLLALQSMLTLSQIANVGVLEAFQLQSFQLNLVDLGFFDSGFNSFDINSFLSSDSVSQVIEIASESVSIL